MKVRGAAKACLCCSDDPQRHALHSLLYQHLDNTGSWWCEEGQATAEW